MAAYLIVSYDVTNPDRYQDYLSGLMPLLDRHGAEVLVLDFDAQALEGERRSVHAVLRFESEAAARGFYFDPGFEPLKKIRAEACENQSVVLTATPGTERASV